jgi:acyl phosphate:glycerol-3-phosphate acyltransferase
VTPERSFLALGAAFVLGAIPFSWILARLLRGVDIRRIGSGNVGATNVARSLGYGPGVLALALDAGKGVAAVLLARGLGGEGDAASWVAAGAGGMAILGHSFNPFLRFKGGKGVATGAGVFGVLAPKALLAAVLIFVLAVLCSRMVSVGSVLAAAALPLAVHLAGGDRSVIVLALLVAALVIARHRANLARIFTGTESRLGGPPAGGPQDDSQGEKKSGSGGTA